MNDSEKYLIVLGPEMFDLLVSLASERRVFVPFTYAPPIGKSGKEEEILLRIDKLERHAEKSGNWYFSAHANMDHGVLYVSGHYIPKEKKGELVFTSEI